MKVIRTRLFDKWLRKLKDEQARTQIAVPLRRLGQGHFGDSKFVGNGVHELRFTSEKDIEFITRVKVMIGSFYYMVATRDRKTAT